MLKHCVELGPTRSRLQSARRLGIFDRMWLVAEIVISFFRARRELRRSSIDAVIATLRREPRSPAPGELRGETPVHPSLVEAHRLGNAVSRTLALMPGDTRCLARSLVLTQLLARRGIASTLVIGTRTAPDFLAHAWVEHAGEPVLPTGGGVFARLVEL
jgi:hypothetical protein